MNLNLMFAPVLLILSNMPASAGPFGVDISTFTPEKYDCTNMKDDYYECKSIPKKHPDIERYIAEYRPDVGLCMIKGVSKDISDNRYGSAIKSAVDGIYAQLKSKYGEGKKVDFLMTGSIWDQPEDWMMSLLKNERIFAYSWQLTTPIEGVDELILGAGVLSTDTTYWAVEFYTPLSKACDKAKENDAANAF